MSKIEIDNIIVKSSRSALSEPILFDVTFTAVAAVAKAVTWKVVYVGSAYSEQFDQVLEDVEIAPIAQPSTLNFQLECAAPDFGKVPRNELLCTTALILEGSYSGKEFIRVGYYVCNSYLGEEDPTALPLEKLIADSERTIIAEKPRITKFQIDWGEEEETETQRLQLQRAAALASAADEHQIVEVNEAVCLPQSTEGDEKISQQLSARNSGEGKQFQ